MRILNVGCGSDTTGTDFVDLYPEHEKVIQLDINTQKLPYEDNVFVKVISNNVLEHLTNPKNFFEEIYRVLKSGGKLEIITDNANYWGFALGGTHRGKMEQLKGGNHGIEDRHYMLYTDWHLRNFARKFNFTVGEINYMPSPNKKLIVSTINSVLRNIPKVNVMGYSQISMECYK